MIKQKTLNLDDALRVINTVVTHAKENEHVGVAVVVMNKDAEIIGAVKMDNRSSRYFKAALRKCYSAAVFERDTSAVVDLHERLDQEQHRGPMEWNDTMLTTLPGGYVVCDEEDNVLGAVSVAGGGGKISDWEFADIAFNALGPGYHHRPGTPRGH